MKTKIKATKTKVRIAVDIEKSEPLSSIAMGYPGISGTSGRTKFDSIVDMFGRGLLVSYVKPGGVEGTYKIDFKDILEAIFNADK